MKIIFDKIYNEYEIVHYVDRDETVFSSYNNVIHKKLNNVKKIKIPETEKIFLAKYSRKLRRLFRQDKMNVVFSNKDRENFIIIRNGLVHSYDTRKEVFKCVLKLQNSRNLLHQSIAVLDNGVLFFGEYGNNKKRKPVPLYKSIDSGVTWQLAYKFKKNSVKHIHGCYWDEYSQKLWILTGDFDGECWILTADKEFKEIEWLGDGSQVWRAVNLFFERDFIYWIMDSQIEDSHLIKYDRNLRTIQIMQKFPGPVWYIKRLEGGGYLAATACEVGPAVKDNYAHLFYSEDLEHWKEIWKCEHDGLPKRFFKFGVIGFPDGVCTKDRFYMFFEALKGFDGKVVQCHLEE